MKLVASDIDGTILKKGAQQVDDETICAINKMMQKGVMFAPASGRQITSLRRLFKNVNHEMIYICENGAFVKYKDKTLLKRTLEQKLGIEIMKDIYQMPDCEILLSGEETSYLMPKTEQYLHRIRDVVKNNVQVITDFSQVKEEFIKISVCDLSGIANSRKHFEEKWADKVSVAVSGELYMDFTAPGVNKGSAIKEISKQFQIASEDIISFGDNYNDIEMFIESGTACVMKSAADEVKKYANMETDSVAKTICEIFSL